MARHHGDSICPAGEGKHCHSQLHLTEPLPQDTPTPTGSGVQQLEFHLSDSVKAAIEKGRAEMERWTGTLSLDFLEYHDYGRDVIKAKGLSPDAVLQLAIQVTQPDTGTGAEVSMTTSLSRAGREAV